MVKKGKGVIRCLDDLNTVTIRKDGDIAVIINAGQCGQLRVPCYSKDWQELLLGRLFVEIGKKVSVELIERVLADKQIKATLKE